MSKPPRPLAELRLPDGQVTAGSRPKRTLRLHNARVATAFDLRGKRVVDLGCAEGLHTFYLAATAEHVLGVDHRQSKVDRAESSRQALGIANATFRCADVRDPALWADLGEIDLVVAWGFLHRITDVFAFLAHVTAHAPAVSLEWRTPVFPLMSRLPWAYHSPVGDRLDPMNLETGDAAQAVGAGPVEAEKIEGATSFWEPSPGAVATIGRQLGHPYARVLGYGPHLTGGPAAVVRRTGAFIIRSARPGRLERHVPAERVHLLLQREPDAVTLRGALHDDARLPDWDVALRKRLRRGPRQRLRRSRA